MSDLHPAALSRSATTWLFVPGDRRERFAKATSSGADVVVLDLEDAVAPDRKVGARADVAAFLASTPRACAVRINAVGTPWHEDDARTLRQAGPAIVMLPKSEEAEVVEDVRSRLAPRSTIIALVESARGVLQATSIAQSPAVSRLVLGSFDLAAELGVDPDHRPAMERARQELVLASAASGLPGPVDGVSGDIADIAAMQHDARLSASLGFAGKLCIHPRQVVPVASVFEPTASEVAWATRVVEASDEGGVVVVDGRMIDAPVVTRARRLLARRPRDARTP